MNFKLNALYGYISSVSYGKNHKFSCFYFIPTSFKEVGDKLMYEGYFCSKTLKENYKKHSMSIIDNGYFNECVLLEEDPNLETFDLDDMKKYDSKISDWISSRKVFE